MLFGLVRILACTAILLFTLGACQAAPAPEDPPPVPTHPPIRVTTTPEIPPTVTALATPTAVSPAPIANVLPASTPNFEATVEARLAATVAAAPTETPPPVLPPTVVRPTLPTLLAVPPNFALPTIAAPELLPTITWEVPQLQATRPVPTTTSVPINALHRTGPDTWLSGEAAVLAREGDELFAAGRFTEAIAKYQEAQKHLDQPSQVLHSWLGHSFRELEDFDEALHQFTAALDIHDNSSDRNNRASVYLLTNRCPEAQADARASLDMEPAIGEGFHSDIEALAKLAECQLRLEQYNQALEYGNQALDLALSHNVRPDRLNDLSAFLAQIDAVAQGLMYPEDFLSELAFRKLNEALEFFYQGNYREAIGALESAQQLNWRPSGLILNFLGRNYSDSGDGETAVQYFSQAVELRDDSYNRTWRALEHFSLGDCVRASSNGRAALAKQPYAEPGFHTSVEAGWIVGYCLALDGHLKEALVPLEESIGLAGESGYPPEEISYMEDVFLEIKDAAKGSTG